MQSARELYYMRKLSSLAYSGSLIRDIRYTRNVWVYMVASQQAGTIKWDGNTCR